MKILVAGGSGLIGNDLTKVLVENHHQVWVLTRRPQNAKLPPGVVPVGWDGKTPVGWENVLEQADAIINLAGENIGDLPWTNERKRSIRVSRMEVGQALVDAIQSANHRPHVLLQASGINYYGVHDDKALDENAPAGNDYLAGVAVDWETSTRPVEEMGLRRVVTRSGIYLTPQGGVLSRYLYPFRLYAGGPLGSGRQWVSWIHRRDEIDAIRFLLENEGAAGAFNLTAPNPVTNAGFAQTLSEVTRRPSWLPVPAFAIKALFGEMSTLVLDGLRVLPERLLSLGYRFAFPELRPALEDLLKQ